MTKLLQWLVVLSIYAAVWLSLVTEKVKVKFLDEHKFLVYLLPVFTVGIFGISCLLLVLWRVATFNDCQDAALELQKEIKMAREDLSKKGLSFD